MKVGFRCEMFALKAFFFLEASILRRAEVFVNIPVKSIAKAYSYAVPDEMSFLAAGWRVFVPFGGRSVEGFVLAVHDEEVGRCAYDLKAIISAVDEEAWFTSEMMEAAHCIADFYLCAPAEAMRLFMPGKSGLKIEVEYEAIEGAEPLSLSIEARQILQYLQKNGAVEMLALQKAFSAFSAKIPAIVARFIQQKAVRKLYRAKARDRARYENVLSLARPLDDEMLVRYRKRHAQRRLLELLAAEGQQSDAALRRKGVSAAVLRAVLESGDVKSEKRRILRDSYGGMTGFAASFDLTKEQQAAVSAVCPYIERCEYRGFLLQGVTGSGKTQVYIEAAAAARKAGRRVIVLVPEIALTSQIVLAFKGSFPEDIVVMHSQLSLSERNDAIFRVRRGEAGIVIGARSALFTPVEDVGLIIMDEEQDMSYKQDEAPRYHARPIAEAMAKIHRAVLLLGSATPSLETAYRARCGELTLLSMPERIGARPLPRVECVDMREELHHGNRNIISTRLRRLIEETMAKKEQLILMLNRRGFSTFVMCRSCGVVVKCPSCGLPLVYHRSGRLLCHHCDIEQASPLLCPECASPYIKYFGSGTEKLEMELKALVPAARIVRMDRDTTTRKLAHQEILTAFREKRYDILLGTQMVAKGHDIPGVTAVGILSADSSLNMPDFRAAERCFMLITQTAGRAGRGDASGQVVVQGYSPEHYAVQAAIKQDYEAFYRQEIAIREQLFYPPFSRLVKLIVQHEKEEAARQEACRIQENFLAAFAGRTDQQIIGPAPALIAQFRGVHRFVLLIKTADLAAVRDFLRGEGLDTRNDVLIDVDPIMTM